MKLDHHFFLMICVLFCAQIIQANLIHGLLGFGEKDSSSDRPNTNPGGSVSPSSPNTPSLPEPSHPATNNNDTPNNNDNNNNPPVSSKTSPSPVQSSSPTIPPLSNSPPSPLSSPAAPVSSNMDNSGPGADATPAQPNKNSPPTTTSPNSNTKDASEPNDTSPNKNHPPDGASNTGNSKNNDSKGTNNNDSITNSDVNAKSKSTSTETDGPAASNTPESNPHSNTGTIAGAVMSGIVGLALIGGMVTWCNRKGGCTKRQKHGVRDGSFNQKDDYSIDMHPHGISIPGIQNNMDVPTSTTGIVEMTPASPFDHSRRLVAGAGAVPGYADTHYHEQQQQDYQLQRKYNHHEDITGDGTGYYYDPQQQLNYGGDYYPPDTYKPDAVDDHHNYKPNAI